MEHWIVTFALLGLALVLIEIFVAPGRGIAGCLGFGFLVVCAYLTSLHFGWRSATSLSIGCLAIISLCFVLFYRFPIFNWMVSGTKSKSSKSGKEADRS